MSIYISTTVQYQVQCDAPWGASPRGCSGRGRPFASADEAQDWAREMGWAGEPPTICPAHIEARLTADAQMSHDYAPILARSGYRHQPSESDSYGVRCYEGPAGYSVQVDGDKALILRNEAGCRTVDMGRYSNSQDLEWALRAIHEGPGPAQIPGLAEDDARAWRIQ